MTDSPFTNRELTAYFNRIDEKLDAIHEQTKKTNGRVTKLEDRTIVIEGENEKRFSGIEKVQDTLVLKVGAGVFVASSAFIFLLNKILELI